MIKITQQRNDNKTQADQISVEENTIFINEEGFEFPKGKDIQFVSPHDQIVNAHRDGEGELHAIVIKQYTQRDCDQFEIKDENGKFPQAEFDVRRTRSIIEPVIAEIKQEEVKEQTVSELISLKENEVKDLKEQYLDAELDDNDKLRLELKQQIQELRQEIAILKENINDH